MELSDATNRFDVIVLGCGAMGAAACMHIARRGRSVLGIEQFRGGHARGSSHGHSRVIRQAYYEHPNYVPLLRRSYELFRALERDSGETLLVQCGALFAGREDSEVVNGSILSAETHAVLHSVLDHDDLRRRFPQFRFPADHIALWEPGAGFVRPEFTTLAHLKLAVAAGASIQDETCVTDWRATDSGFEVETSRGSVTAERLVLTAGAWTGRLLKPMSSMLQVTRQPTIWFEASATQRAAHTGPALPVWLIDQHDGTAVYGIPPHALLDGPRGMKVALHGRGVAATTLTIDHAVTNEEIESVRTALDRVLPAAAETITATSVCMYTNSPDGHFIVDQDEQTGAIVACGFSGHGFKFAPVIGEALADLALEGKSDLPIDFLSRRPS